MRKIYILMAVVLGIAFSTLAQVAVPVTTTPGFPRFLPTDLVGAEDIFAVQTESGFDLYNEDFELIRNIEIPKFPEITSDVTKEYWWDGYMEYSETKPISVTPRIVPFEYFSDSYSHGFIDVSSTLFNDNEDDFEYMVEQYKLVDISSRESYGDDDGGEVIYKGTKPTLSGYKIMSAKGTEIASIQFPEGYTNKRDTDIYEGVLTRVSSTNAFFLTIPIFPYIISSGNIYTKFVEPTYLVYRIDPEAGSVKMVGEPIKGVMRVTPTLPQQGTPVTVDLGEVDGAAQVCVVSADGATVHRCVAESGSVTFPTYGFAPGLYVVSVTDRSGKREAAKIIVR